MSSGSTRLRFRRLTSSRSICRAWLCVDIDLHEGDSATPEGNLRAALAWYAILQDHGFHPLLLDSNGKGGLRIYVLFTDAIPKLSRYVALVVGWCVMAKVWVRERARGFPPARADRCERVRQLAAHSGATSQTRTLVTRLGWVGMARRGWGDR